MTAPAGARLLVGPPVEARALGPWGATVLAAAAVAAVTTERPTDVESLICAAGCV